eukprot:scaffold8093_cov215-Prasinococcus_capsulatus_cf.AAC.1
MLPPLAGAAVALGVVAADGRRGNRALGGQAYIDLVNNLTGGGGAGSMRALEDLRDKIGSEVARPRRGSDPKRKRKRARAAMLLLLLMGCGRRRRRWRAQVYIDIAGWHLYLRDTKYAQELAVAVFKKVARPDPPSSSCCGMLAAAVTDP